MNPSEIRNRLVALLSEEEAFDLLNMPNAALGGASPQAVIDNGNPEAVAALVGDLESKERCRAQWIKNQPLAVELLIPDYERQ